MIARHSSRRGCPLNTQGLPLDRRAGLQPCTHPGTWLFLPFLDLTDRLRIFCNHRAVQLRVKNYSINMSRPMNASTYMKSRGVYTRYEMTCYRRAIRSWKRIVTIATCAFFSPKMVVIWLLPKNGGNLAPWCPGRSCSLRIDKAMLNVLVEKSLAKTHERAPRHFRAR